MVQIHLTVLDGILFILSKEELFPTRRQEVSAFIENSTQESIQDLLDGKERLNDHEFPQLPIKAFGNKFFTSRHKYEDLSRSIRQYWRSLPLLERYGIEDDLKKHRSDSSTYDSKLLESMSRSSSRRR